MNINEHLGSNVLDVDDDLTGNETDEVLSQDHPNISLLKQLDLHNLAASADLFADDFVWHYFNPKLPDLQGDYVGLKGLQAFFKTLGEKTAGTFKVEPVSVTAVGDELVVAHVRDTLTIQTQSIAIDAVAVWRIVNGRISEAWDIPSVYTTANPSGADETQQQKR